MLAITLIRDSKRCGDERFATPLAFPVIPVGIEAIGFLKHRHPLWTPCARDAALDLDLQGWDAFNLGSIFGGAEGGRGGLIAEV